VKKDDEIERLAMELMLGLKKKGLADFS
jgi:hypothetical protein